MGWLFFSRLGWQPRCVCISIIRRTVAIGHVPSHLHHLSHLWSSARCNQNHEEDAPEVVLAEEQDQEASLDLGNIAQWSTHQNNL